jgi:hypothetical protein
MARIKINDLPKDMKISANELKAIRGGKLRSPTGIIIESGGSFEREQHILWAPPSRGARAVAPTFCPGCGILGRF